MPLSGIYALLIKVELNFMCCGFNNFLIIMILLLPLSDVLLNTKSPLCGSQSGLKAGKTIKYVLRK